MTPRPAATIADTLAGFLHAGLALTVASRDADNLPEGARALGVHFTADQQRLVVDTRMDGPTEMTVELQIPYPMIRLIVGSETEGHAGFHTS